MRLVEGMRSRGLSVPNIDPEDGGIAARVLCLLESPGPKAVGSTFVSRDNPDPSARNMGRLLDQAGIARSEVVLWNVVPWCVSTVDQNRNATVADIVAAAFDTQTFLEALLQLRAVVFCGRRAQRVIGLLRVPPGVRAFATFHTGAMAYNQTPLRAHMHATFDAVAHFLREQQPNG
jgi:hypothetical protein